METAVGSEASKPTSLSPHAPDIDSGWDESDKPRHSSATASAQALAPKRVISIGPPVMAPSTGELVRDNSPKVSEPVRSASPKEKRRQIESVAGNAPRKVSAVPAESKSDIELLNRRSRASESKAKAKTQSTPKPSSLSKGVDPSTLKKLLTEGPESDFDPTDIARLVTDVMGSQPPPAPADVSEKPVFPPVSTVSIDSTASVPVDSTAPAVSVPIVSTRQSAPPSSAAASTSVATGSVAPAPQSENASENLMEPDGWDVPIDAPPTETLAPVVAAQPAQIPVKAESNLKDSDKPAAKPAPVSEKPHSKPDSKKKSPVSATTKPQLTPEGPESELSGEFFAIGAPTSGHVEEFHEPDEMIDERHMRSISPEVRARRARYRRIVLVLVVGMTLLLAAAIALKMLHKH